MFEFEPLDKKEKEKRKKGGEREKIINFFLYGGLSGLHAHTHGHAWLGVVCCCWHVAVGCCALLWYPVCLLVLANHRRRVAGCLANKLHCLLYSFWFLPTDEARGISGETSWINHLWLVCWNFFPDYVVPVRISQILQQWVLLGFEKR